MRKIILLLSSFLIIGCQSISSSPTIICLPPGIPSNAFLPVEAVSAALYPASDSFKPIYIVVYLLQTGKVMIGWIDGVAVVADLNPDDPKAAPIYNKQITNDKGELQKQAIGPCVWGPLKDSKQQVKIIPFIL